MSTITTPLRQEIILGSDGIFIKRETRESVITRADNAITQCTREDALCMSNIPTQIRVNGRDHLMYVAHNQGIDPEFAYSVVHLPLGFPLPGAYLTNDEGKIVLRPRNNHSDASPEHFQVQDFYYYNSDYEIYVMNKFPVTYVGSHRARLMRTQEIRSWLFAVCVHENGINKVGDVITFNLPNIYDDGRICGGQDYRIDDLVNNNNGLPIYKIYDCTAELASKLYESPCNNDLYSREIGDAHIKIKRTESGEHITCSTSAMEETNPEYKPSSSFYKPVTNATILDFVSCLISTQN